MKPFEKEIILLTRSNIISLQDCHSLISLFSSNNFYFHLSNDEYTMLLKKMYTILKEKNVNIDTPLQCTYEEKFLLKRLSTMFIDDIMLISVFPFLEISQYIRLLNEIRLTYLLD